MRKRHKIGIQIKDMTGQKFGKLTVISMVKKYDEKKMTNRTFCLCKCECGNEKVIYPGNLRSGRTKSCGCLEKYSRYNRKHYIDIKGNVYGKLAVIKKIDKKASNGGQYWLCKCECGNYTEVTYTNLTQKKRNTTSCGCNVKEYFTSTIPDYKNKRFGKLVVLELTDNRTSKGRCIWKCLCDCGNITYVVTSDLTSNNTMSCGLCNCSHGEEFIKQHLIENNINFVQQKVFKDCKYKKPLYFDFYLPDYNIVIEYDGVQHYFPVEHFGGEEEYSKTIIRDKIKNSYCEKNKIKIIRIPYTLSNKEIKEIIVSIKNP